MKKLLASYYLCLITTTPLFATNFIIEDHCSQETIIEKSIPIDGKSIGHKTIELLEEHRVQYQGSEKGINSIESSPMGDDALVVLNDYQMYAFGWCFSVNGNIPLKYSHEIFISKWLKK